MQRPIRIPTLVLILATLLPGASAALAATPHGAGEAPHGKAASQGKAAAHGKAALQGKDARAGDRAKTVAAAPAGKAPVGKAAAKAGAKGEAQRPAVKAPEVRAQSVGHPNDGRLEGGIRLNTALKELRAVPTGGQEDVRWGLPALVRMIERAARGVAKRYPGSALEVGDLSRKGGGEIAGHGSHESGRDADLGFYAVDEKGRQVQGKSFVRFGANLRASNARGARFDVARNWLLVQEMLTDPRARVSHIFIAEPLKQALLAEAKRRGVSRALLTRAQLAMMQPTGGEPHDDHMHVRISCPDAGEGRCVELAKNAPSKHRPQRAVAAKGGKAGKIGKSATTRGGKARGGKAATAGAKAKAGHAGKAGAGQQARASAGQQAKGRGHEQEKVAGGEKAARAAAARATLEKREDAAPAAARGSEQVPMMLDAIDLAILEPLRPRRRAAEPREDAEAEADGAEVRDALDESGAPKITD